MSETSREIEFKSTSSAEALKARLASVSYIADDALAKALAAVTGARLIRLQCYEGLDAASAIYEWNYQRQLLAIKAHERDESADEEFEAYLLEVLSDFQVSVPELGTIRAKSIPHVILTANGTRDLSDALRRRCLYVFVEFPEPERELAILRARVPGAGERLAGQVVRFIDALRREDLEKKPGIAETLDWVAALLNLEVESLSGDPESVRASLVCLLKTESDRAAIPPEVLERLADRAAA